MTPFTEATLASLKTDFLASSDIARLVALNAALEAARMGNQGEDYAAEALSADERVRRAIASSGQAATLLRDTLGDCMLPASAP